MMNSVRSLTLSLLFATSAAHAADPVFYVLAIVGKGSASLFTGARRLPPGSLPYASIDRTSTGCCFKAGARPGAGGAPVLVRTCYTAEGLRLRLFREPAARQPYARYDYYLGYEVEPACR